MNNNKLLYDDKSVCGGQNVVSDCPLSSEISESGSLKADLVPESGTCSLVQNTAWELCTVLYKHCVIGQPSKTWSASLMFPGTLVSDISPVYSPLSYLYAFHSSPSLLFIHHFHLFTLLSMHPFILLFTHHGTLYLSHLKKTNQRSCLSSGSNDWIITHCVFN